MKDNLVHFLNSVAEGKFGNTVLDKADVEHFIQSANQEEWSLIEDYYWEWLEAYGNGEPIVVSELEDLIDSVIKAKA